MKFKGVIEAVVVLIVLLMLIPAVAGSLGTAEKVSPTTDECPAPGAQSGWHYVPKTDMSEMQLHNPSVWSLAIPDHQLSINSHPMDREDVTALQKLVGTREQGIGYNVMVDGHGTGLAPPTEEEWMNMIGKVMYTDSVTLPGPALPSTFDYSTSIYFPVVGDQGVQGSCAAWASTYYAYGFLEAKDQGWSGASLGYDSELMSPAWTYNKVNYEGDHGSSRYGNMMVINTWGAATMYTMPYSDSDYLSWGSQDSFREAPLHRAAQVYTISYTGSATVNMVKSLVYSQTPVTFSINASQFTNGFSDGDYIISASEYSQSATNHAQTIVGFDDSVGDNGDVGAFKVVNSWGASWGSNGYYWLTYNAFMKIGSLLNLAYVTDKISYQPSLLAVWHFNFIPSRDAPLTLSAVDTGTGSHLMDLIPYYLGTVNRIFPSFMCYDISDLSGYLNSANRKVEITVDNSADSGSLGSFKVEKYDGWYQPGRASEISIQSPDVPATTPCSVTNSVPTYSSIPIRTALDVQTNYFWSYGNAAWVSENNQYDFGSYAMQSGDVGDGGVSTLTTNVIGPGSVTFDWKVSSESQFDFLRFYLDGAQQTQISGIAGWSTVSVAFSDGRHTIDWEYSKDASLSIGSDCGWVDRVVLVQTDDSFGSNVGVDSAGFVYSQSYSNLRCIHDDWYKIWLKPGDDLSVSINFPDYFGDLDLYLYAPDGTTVLASSTGISDTEQASIYDVALWGYYFIEVRGYLGMVNIYTMDVMPTYYADPGASSYVRITSGNGSFASVTPSNKVITALPGSTIDGWLNVATYNAWPSSKTVPFVRTPSWGDHASSYQVIDAFTPSGLTGYGLHYRLTSPSIPGTYYLLMAFRNENDISFVASMTASQLGAPIWNDGNDLADLSPSKILDAQQNGRASVWWRVTEDYVYSLSLPMDAITVNVPDNIPPVTTVSMSGTAGSNGWYRGTVQVTLTSTDVGTGVQSSYYRVDGGSWGLYTGAFSVTGDGTHSVDFYSVDNSSNVESVKTIAMKIDGTPPATTASATGTMGSGGWYTSPVDISLTGTDGISGLDQIKFRLDGGAWQTYLGTFNVAIDGSHTLDYYSIDKAGNAEGFKTISFKIDTGPPTKPTSNTSDPLTGSWSNDNTVAVTWFGAIDAGSGVQGYSFVWSQDPATIPDTVMNTVGTSTTSSILADGMWYLHVRSVDNLGSWTTGAYHIGPFKIDVSAPSVPIVQGPPEWSNYSILQFTWNAPADLSGILGYSCAVDTLPDDSIDTIDLGTVWSTLLDGSHQFYIKACDLAHNWGLAASYMFVLDTQPPVLIVDQIDGGILNTSIVTVSYLGVDSLSGMDHYEIQVDHGVFISVGTDVLHQLSGITDGIHTFTVKAFDRAGNQRYFTVEATVDTVAPVTEVSVNGTEGSDGWYRSGITITLDSSDATTGVKSTKYSFDNGSWQNYSTPIAVSAEGSHTISFYAEDLAGNRNQVSHWQVKVDTQLPSLGIGTMNGTVYNSKSVTIQWSSADATSGVDHFEYSLDGAAFKSSGDTNSVGLADLEDGTHQLIVRVFDAAGNVVEKSITFRVDTNAFSPTGPFGPWLDVGLVLAIVAVLLVAVFALRGRKKTAPTKPSTEGEKKPP